MHKKILEEASFEQLKDFVDYSLCELKSKDYEMYEELELQLYKKVYGCHFNSWMLEKALKHMINEDGTSGAHWDLEQTTSVARNNDITFSQFNEYDWCYVMNMIYSDYYGSVPNDMSVYIRMSRKFLEDKDAEEGKAFRYYVAMK